jgi:ABC-type transporter Mla subunit MlaD
MTSSETNAMSSLSDEMNEVLEEADSNNAEVQDSLTTLEELMELNQSAQDFMNTLTASISGFQAKLKKLPVSSQAVVKKDASYKSLQTLVSTNKKYTDSIKSVLLRIPTAQNAQALQGLLDFLSSDPTSTVDYDLDTLVMEVSALFPEYVCVKSSTTQLLKNGKCPKGFTKKALN